MSASRDLEETTVRSVRRHGSGFAFNLENGATVRARCIVAATGVGHFRYVPPPLDEFPAEMVSHSYDHCDLSRLVGRRVAVIGGGASAIDHSALLKTRGCDVTLICRRQNLIFANPPSAAKRSLWRRFRHPRSGLGKPNLALSQAVMPVPNKRRQEIT
ncbi:NAD(P)-binding domain-containing protein [Bradyrhizobium sp. CCBAU 11386]|uniref:NAD(P)-binding domain-containing protein n=1 Tax=Bradyrhizobium sp. CCBAU 11386 TaxID=1630837 RepID=UPI003FA4D076